MLFKWLDKTSYVKCIHPITIEEIGRYKDKATVVTFNIKLDSYEQLKTLAPMHPKVEAVSRVYDINENDPRGDYCARLLFYNSVEMVPEFR